MNKLEELFKRGYEVDLKPGYTLTLMGLPDLLRKDNSLEIFKSFSGDSLDDVINAAWEHEKAKRAAKLN